MRVRVCKGVIYWWVDCDCLAPITMRAFDSQPEAFARAIYHAKQHVEKESSEEAE